MATAGTETKGGATQQQVLNAPTPEQQQNQAADAAATPEEIAEALKAFETPSGSAPLTLDAVIEETDRRQLSKMKVETERFAHNQRLANLFVTSGLFRDIKGGSVREKIAQAMVKIELGASMGFTPIEAMQGIDIIVGRAAIGAHLRAARMQAAGYNWRFTKMDEQACVLKVFFAGEELGEIGYTLDEAKRAGLVGKDNWKNNPSDMLFARAITRAQRRFAPAALKGVSIMDTTEVEDLTGESAPEQKTDAATAALRERLAATKKGGE